MKKSKILIITFSSIAIFTVASFGIYFLVNYLISKKDNIKNSINGEIDNVIDECKNSLTNEIVKKNFESNGIWENKESLDFSDFLDYQYINIDAFNNIDKHISYIELPSYLKISTDYNCQMDWYSIDIIKVKSYKKDLLFIQDNILYSHGISRNIAYTISNRIEELDISINNNNNTPVSIYNDFYDETIFKNVKSITFSSNCEISSIGDQAFLNCKILNTNINLSTQNYAYIGYQSFKNTNIESFKIKGKWNSIILFNEEVFCDSINMNNFSCLNFIISNWFNNTFRNIGNTFSFIDNSFIGNFNSNCKLIGNNNFNSLSLNLLYFEVWYNGTNNTLFSDINILDEANFKMSGYLDKSYWENKGLSSTLIDKYIKLI